jgi:tRNA threonylcarbamoyladenosine biosynthesis protein TsaB
MNLLALDTATPSTVVGVLHGGGVCEQRDDPPPGERPRHAQLVLVLADRALLRAGLGWTDIERVGVGIGPGSFTGLRIGVASARALAQSAGVPLVGISTLRALAALALGSSGERDSPAAPRGGGIEPTAVRGGGIEPTAPRGDRIEPTAGGGGVEPTAPRRGVLAVLDARRGEAFVAAYRGSPAAPDEVLGAAAVAPAALGKLVGDLGDAAGWWAVGDGAIRFRGDLEPAGVVVPPDDSPLHRVHGEALCRLAATAPPQAWDAVTPEYLRDPDAELALRAPRP